MAGRFAVDLVELDRVLAAMRSCADSVDELADDLEREVALLHEQWTGLAATAQREAHAEWERGLRRMRAALDELRAVGRTAGDNYAAAGAANAALWERVR